MNAPIRTSPSAATSLSSLTTFRPRTAAVLKQIYPRHPSNVLRFQTRSRPYFDPTIAA